MGRSSIGWLVGLLVCTACGEDENFPPFTGGGDGGLVDAPRPNGDATDAPPGPGDAPPPEGTAPQIELANPEPGTLISGLLVVEVNVFAQSAVDTVVATIAGTSQFAMEQVSGTLYRGVFDTAPLAGLVAPTIVVRARDVEGLSGELGFVITLDNEPPFASLDPPNLRATRIEGSSTVCSSDFDPVGSDAPNDGETVPQLIELRGRVADVGNTGTLNSTLAVPLAGVDRVELYVFDDSSKPLVVDTNGDGECDNINPDIVPASVPMLANEAAVVQMTGIPPTGTAFFSVDIFGGSNATCSVGQDAEPPPQMCFGEDATIAIQSLIGEPEIFGIPPVSGFNCLGFAFDARASNITDGFACAALLVVDKLGNRSVSEPLRICIDSDLAGNECLPLGQIAAAGARPNCTGTVTGGTVTNTACTPRRFFRGVADEFELVLQ
jgi:hypothetical protein